MERLVEKIHEIYEELRKQFPLLKHSALRLIHEKCTEVQLIEWKLDELLDYSMIGMGNKEFFQLLSYYSTINKEAAEEYRNIYKEFVEE